MEFRVDITALVTLADRLRSNGDAVAEGLQKGMQTGAAKLSSWIVQNKLSGQVLNIRTGNLAQSVETPSPGPSSATSVTYLIGGKFYGKFHEFGTSRMRARPWLSPSIQEQSAMVAAEVISAVQEAIKL